MIHNILAPPGYAMWCQLENECQKMRSALTNNLIHYTRHISQSPHQATPRTPNISSMHRNQPIACSTKSKYPVAKINPIFFQNCEVPPPPPPLPKKQTSSCYSSPASNLLKYDDISPTENPKVIFKNGRNTSNLDFTKNNSRSQSPFMSPVTQSKNIISKSYSPVSNPPTPRSPLLKDFTPVELHSISQFSKLADNYKTECISTSKKCSDDDNDNDDDNMSLSSISSNEDNKVELNVKNVKHGKLLKPLPLTQANIILSGTIRPSHIYQFPPNNMQNQINYYSLLPPPLPTGPQGPPPLPTGPQIDFQVRQPNFNPLNSQAQFPPYQNSQIIRAALMTLPPNHNISLPHHQISHIPFTHDQVQNGLYVADSKVNMHGSSSVTENIFPLPAHNIPVPYTPNELLLAFQVKTGCARDLSIELKRILLKDTLKKLVEQSAFSAFENWWSKQVSNHPKNTEVLSENSNSSTAKPLSEDKQNSLSNGLLQESAKEPNTISALLQTLFGFDKNNENRPSTSNFLSSFRITRKPHLQPNSLKSSQTTRKRSSWSLIHGSRVKQQRLEESEDEPMDTVSEDEVEDEEKVNEEFEQLALRQSESLLLIFLPYVICYVRISIIILLQKV